jgi:hypothetical protein
VIVSEGDRRRPKRALHRIIRLVHTHSRRPPAPSSNNRRMTIPSVRSASPGPGITRVPVTCCAHREGGWPRSLAAFGGRGAARIVQGREGLEQLRGSAAAAAAETDMRSADCCCVRSMKGAFAGFWKRWVSPSFISIALDAGVEGPYEYSFGRTVLYHCTLYFIQYSYVPPIGS